jgi:hypothetical protein
MEVTKQREIKMKVRTVLALLLLLAVTLMVSACGGTSAIHAAKATQSPQAKADLAKGEAIVKDCISKGNVITKSGRKAIFTCIAPPGQKAAVESCAQKAVASDGFLTKHKREKLYQDLALCVEGNR